MAYREVLMVAIPRDAATILLLRRGAGAAGENLEVLMVLRHPRSLFVPNYHVYPGGCLDEDDYVPEMERFSFGVDRKKAQNLIANITPSEKALGVWVAGIRETFEEVGVLLAYEKDGSLVSMDSDARAAKYNAYRRALAEGRIKFRTMLEREELKLAADRLLYFSHWITPEPLPYRYDVRFFLARAPEDQPVMHDGIELTDHIWITPSKALAQYEKGRIGMVLPTIMTLVELSRFKTIEEALHSTKRKTVHTVLTRIKEINGDAVEIMPDGRTFNGRPPAYPKPGEGKKCG
jgi:8-oxo-dGTP pyrophosphatase MutT (NUDIX family)